MSSNVRFFQFLLLVAEVQPKPPEDVGVTAYILVNCITLSKNPCNFFPLFKVILTVGSKRKINHNGSFIVSHVNPNSFNISISKMSGEGVGINGSSLSSGISLLPAKFDPVLTLHP